MTTALATKTVAITTKQLKAGATLIWVKFSPGTAGLLTDLPLSTVNKRPSLLDQALTVAGSTYWL